MFCDLQLTKDGQGMCQTNLDLGNRMNIHSIYPNQNNTYLVNEEKVSGYFSIDFTTDELFNNVLDQFIMHNSHHFIIVAWCI